MAMCPCFGSDSRAAGYRVAALLREARAGRGRSGFTLIELLIVVTIIAVVAGIAIPNLLEARRRSRDARAAADAAAVVASTQLYINDTGSPPPAGDYSALWNGSAGTLYMARVFDPWGVAGTAYM